MIEIVEKLNKLGNSHQEIADSLRKENCIGFRNHPLGCPLAFFINRHLKDGFAIVEPDRYTISKSNDKRDVFILPTACTQFIQVFDIGGYDDLSASYSWLNK